MSVGMPRNNSLISRFPRSGMITYSLGRVLYVALTNHCNTTPVFVTRGPGFKISPDRFAPLADGLEPNPPQVLAAVDDVFQGPHRPDSITFAGYGEPTLCLATMLEVSQVQPKVCLLA